MYISLETLKITGFKQIKTLLRNKINIHKIKK